MKTGLWKKQSQKGVNYYNGKIKIGEKEYNIRIFKNVKDKETSPDLMLYIDEKEQEKRSYTVDEIAHDFGKDVEIDESELAF